ncbi:hydroxymethylglutaryl-CoA lyase [Labrys sp. LIt4]|uniref:hydroxymethylglutaryl-CoA lyase n=1 Tax=Labrys sp. LIt4 TaxID=2821355 RepID=UPI001ADF7826|nr:hydroxymethylglutaryl-CoA lyase [Labrys sp. LIt4]MBP0578865.1 hydroxymethylglutaryl-CoA lyase [Labrys sp. LIt4]
MSRAGRVEIFEVGPRDGLQNESRVLPVETRIAMIRDLAAAGLRTVEAGSFVSPRNLPQMAGTAEVLAGLSGLTRPSFSGESISRSTSDGTQRGDLEIDPPNLINLPVLVPNARGFADALAAKARHIAVFAAASESFSRRNINRGIEESLAEYRPIVAGALAAGLKVRGYVSCVLGCPYEGHVPVSAVVSVATALASMGCQEISLGDTIGVGTPDAARAMTAAVASEIGIQRVAVHFHDTYGQALANVLACLELGVTVVDSSVAGLGGCPYAPGASGNLATEDLVYMLEGLGVETGVDLDRVAAAGRTVCAALGAAPRSRTGQALAAKIK